MPRTETGRIDLVVAGGTVLTMDSEETVFENGAVAISGGALVAVGARRAIESRYRARRSIDARGRRSSCPVSSTRTRTPR